MYGSCSTAIVTLLLALFQISVSAMYVCMYCMPLLNACVSQGRAAVEFDSEKDSLSDLVYASPLLSDADIRKELVSNIVTICMLCTERTYVCLCSMYVCTCTYVCLCKHVFTATIYVRMFLYLILFLVRPLFNALRNELRKYLIVGISLFTNYNLTFM